MKNQKKLESLNDVIVENKKVFSTLTGGGGVCNTYRCMGDANGGDVLKADKDNGTICKTLKGL